MRYPEEVVEEVRLRSDIVDVVGSRVKITKKGSSYFGLCPFHSEKSPSFSVSPSKQIFYCFGCGAGGNVFSFIQKYENYSYPEAIKYLADQAGVQLPEAEFSAEQKEREAKRNRILEANLEAAKYFYYQLRGQNGTVGMEYFKERKLTDETMNKFGLGFSLMTSNDLYLYLKKKGFSDEILTEAGLVKFDEKWGTRDTFWNRVMFPIQDINHRVIGFGGRVMSDIKPKYVNTNETMVFDKSRNLYGLNFARTSRKDHFILCEGYMDVIAMHQAGFTEAVASLGTAFTTGQAQVLKRYADKAYLAYDSDGAGTTAALRAIGILRDAGMTGKVINLQPYKDPDEFIKNLGTEEFQKRIDTAENSFFFEVRMIERNYDIKDPDGRTKFLREVAIKLVGFEDEIERESYIRAVADKYDLTYDAMKKQVVSQAARNGGEYKPIERPKSGINSKPEPGDAALTSQRILLTWICEEPGIYDVVKPYISVADFTNEVYKAVAGWLFSDLLTGNVNPGAYVSRFEEESDQAVCAAIFNTKLDEISGKEAREHALHDIVYKIKKNSCDALAAKPDQNMEEIMKLLADKKALQELQKMTFSLPE
ncbi:MAG: DNA primase [Lachnospiraceae bacterium]|nr:DNA primase [Lachnospiraceae bacterium]